MMRIFTSVSAIPPRQENMRISLESIIQNQTVLPNTTVLNICNNYHRFPMEKIEPKNIPLEYKNLSVNFVEDNGPLTKILGFLDFYDANLSSGEDDILIIHDDDIIYKEFLLESLTSPIKFGEKDAVTHLYGRGLKIYSDDIDDDSVEGNFVYPCLPGYLGISFKINKKISQDLREYIEEIVSEIPESKYHDDAIISSYLRTRKNRILWIRKENIIDVREDLAEDESSLSKRENEEQKRNEICYKILKFIESKKT